MARILLVDDDRDIRELGRALLETAGHDIFTADSVVTALQFISQNALDVLITDANMPGHSGYDLVRTLRRDGKHPHLTVAMLTGRREKRDIERALELGVHDYIVKPIDPQLFLQKVTDLLERRPPQERAEVEFALAKISAKATVITSVDIKSVSELGLTLTSPHRFTESTRLQLESEVFAEIGIDPPALRVLSSHVCDGGWEVRVSFVGADERTLTKVRAWIHSKSTRKNRLVG